MKNPNHNWFGGKEIEIVNGNKYIGEAGTIARYNDNGALWNPYINDYNWYMWKIKEGNSDIDKLNVYFQSVPDKFKAKFKLVEVD